jgi:hypothetical protein
MDEADFGVGDQGFKFLVRVLDLRRTAVDEVFHEPAMLPRLGVGKASNAVLHC